MADTQVMFRGLFTLVRHVEPRADYIAPGASEPMTVVFPKTAQGTHHGETDEHICLLRLPNKLAAVHQEALNAAGIPTRVTRIKDDSHYTSFRLSGWTIDVREGEQRANVEHEPDEVFGEDEPENCSLVSSPRSFAPLSRLPNLNRLTRGRFDGRNLEPNAPAVQSTVRLSGGRLAGVLSQKPFATAFYEFFDKHGTIVIQPAVEDVLLEVPLNEQGELALGFRHLNEAGEPALTLRLRPAGPLPVVIESMGPPKPIHLGTTAEHFLLFYPLMEQQTGLRRPVPRYLARCEEGRLVHKLPRIEEFDAGLTEFRRVNPTFATVDGASPCLVSQVFFV